MSEEKDINKILGRTQEWDREAITRLHAEAAALRADLARVTGERDAFLKAEHELSAAYLRLRGILKAFDTPYAPGSEQVWQHVEDRAKTIVADRDTLAKRVRGLEGALQKIGELDDFPELTSSMRTGLFCGVEDRNLTDRYEGAEYGWQDAAERCAEWAKNMAALTPPAQQQEKHTTHPEGDSR